MYDELMAVSKKFGALHLVQEDLKRRNTFNARAPGLDVEEVYVHENLFFSHQP